MKFRKSLLLTISCLFFGACSTINKHSYNLQNLSTESLSPLPKIVPKEAECIIEIIELKIEVDSRDTLVKELAIAFIDDPSIPVEEKVHQRLFSNITRDWYGVVQCQRKKLPLEVNKVTVSDNRMKLDYPTDFIKKKSHKEFDDVGPIPHRNPKDVKLETYNDYYNYYIKALDKRYKNTTFGNYYKFHFGKYGNLSFKIKQELLERWLLLDDEFMIPPEACIKLNVLESKIKVTNANEWIILGKAFQKSRKDAKKVIYDVIAARLLPRK